VTATKSDGDFDHGGNNRDALGIAHNLVGDALVRSTHDFVENLGGIIDPLSDVRLVFICTPTGSSQNAEAAKF
jgi:hypothetical protein